MINFISVTKQFGNQFYGLRDVSFAVEPGELVLITGPSGSGKTTIMKLLTKEYLPTSGEIEFQGTKLSQIKSGQIHHHRRQIGVVFQDYKLLPEMNIWENIALSLNIIGKPEAEIESRVTDLLELIQLNDKAFLFPTQLSGGEAQRVSIARALASAPAVIFADEPTGNLDPETSVTIARLLHKINQLGTTVLLATHDQGVVQTLAKHRMIKLDQGRVVADSQVKTKIAQPIHEKTEPEPVAQPSQPVKKAKTKDRPVTKNESQPEKVIPAKPAEPESKSKPVAQPRFTLSKIWPFGKKKNPPAVNGTDQPFSGDFQEVAPNKKVEVEVEDIDADE